MQQGPLHRCLATTNIVESPNAGVRRRTRRVTRWKDASMVRRWAAAAFLDTEKNFRKIMGYKDLWMLDAVLNPTATAEPKVAEYNAPLHRRSSTLNYDWD